MPVSFWTSWPDNEINKMKKKTKNDETKKEGQQKFKIIIEENDFYFVFEVCSLFLSTSLLTGSFLKNKK